MELTKEILKNNGFYSNHENYIICTWQKHNSEGKEWNIRLETEYIPLEQKLGYNVMAWKVNSNHVIDKRVQASYITTIEELNLLLKFCELDLISTENGEEQ